MAQELLSGRIFDTLIGSNVAKDRGWTILELMPNSCHRWFPWGTQNNFYTDGDAWNVSLTDEEFWGAITNTTNHKDGFLSYMIKVIDNDK
eukprot:14826900-Heterocapsa_arctica.AAC.1